MVKVKKARRIWNKSYLDQVFIVADALTEVQQSNMSKLGDDGKPIYNEHGKVLKGPNYFKTRSNKVYHMKEYKIASIAGDGIGKEVLPEGIKILKEVAKQHQFKLL